MKKTGILLINLGTPDSPKPKDVRKYLIEFLTDGRVVDYSWLKRQMLVRGVIVPLRYRNSAKNYARIWTKEGSPLKIYGKIVKNKLQETLGNSFQVELAMRYQSPSIPDVLNQMKACDRLIIVPLFPQYASATTGSTHQKVMETVSKWTTIPEISFVNSFPIQPEMIDAFCDQAGDVKKYDHLLFSFHGLPERQVRDVKQPNYLTQCHQTAQAIVDQLKVSPNDYTICFQSRLGREPWLRPYTSEVLEEMVAKGKKKLLVFSPSFVCDCLETIDEIGNEYRHEFLSKGGEQLDLVPGLNDHPLWIEALKKITTEALT